MEERTMFKKVVNVFMKNTQEAGKEMTVNNEVTAMQTVGETPMGCHDLMVQENSLPQESETAPTEIKTWTEFVGDMDEYDRAVETDMMPHMPPNPVLNRESLVIQFKQGTKIYVWINEGEGGEREIEFTQQFGNGTFSGTLKFPQADILTLVSVMHKKITNPRTLKRSDKFIDEAQQQYLNKCRGNLCEILPVEEIMEALAVMLPQLPVYTDGMGEMEREELHTKVCSIVRTLLPQGSQQHKSYYAIDNDGLMYVAESLGMSRTGLLSKLSKCNLLYLTPRSTKYQTFVREGDNREAWRYCIIRNIGFANNKEDVRFDF